MSSRVFGGSSNSDWSRKKKNKIKRLGGGNKSPYASSPSLPLITSPSSINGFSQTSKQSGHQSPFDTSLLTLKELYLGSEEPDWTNFHTWNKSLPKRRVKQSELSKFWGFPVYFAADEDKEKRTKRLEKLKCKRSVEEMRVEEERTKRIALHKKQVDYQLFLLCVSRWGALDGTLYCSSEFPGKAYEEFADKTARKLQKWWADMFVFRALRKAEAASFMQRIYRGHAGRKDHARVTKAKTHLARLRYRFAHKCLRTWVLYTRRSKKIKRMMKRALGSKQRNAFQDWANILREKKRLRKEKIEKFGRKLKNRHVLAAYKAWHQRTMQAKKIAKALKRLEHRQLIGPYNSWALHTARMVGVKRMLRQRLSSMKRFVFESWRDYTVEQIEIRERFGILYAEQEDAVSLLQRVFRGFLGRNWVKKMMKHEIRSRARAGNRAKKRQILEAQIREEEERSSAETEAMNAAGIMEKERIERLIAKKLRSSVEYKNVVSKAKELREEATRDHEKLSKKEAFQIARAGVISEGVEKARSDARDKFRSERPPPYFCKHCMKAFALKYMYEKSLCCDAAES